ncbi:hypothetical protein BCR44DRAFT_1067698 [Catenaria anguillulae PL171]|uniref:Uncharacterized protein n=1 Tax=Catenaria anguillulae PL171 TaxID=765915 RepID=A0A1Y2HRJ0_9FUNG|nr:hypothetical protein BCR44DRAFT_1067698 [Catenaria anguillulae PL171]
MQAMVSAGCTQFFNTDTFRPAVPGCGRVLYRVCADSMLGGLPLGKLQAHMLIPHLVESSAQQWAQRTSQPKAQLAAADAVTNGPSYGTRIPTPAGTPMYSEYEAHIVDYAKSHLNAVVPSVALDDKTLVHVQETVGTVLCCLGAVSLEQREGWKTTLATRLSSVLNDLSSDKDIQCKRIQGRKFALTDAQDSESLVLSLNSWTTPSMLEPLPFLSPASLHQPSPSNDSQSARQTYSPSVSTLIPMSAMNALQSPASAAAMTAAHPGHNIHSPPASASSTSAFVQAILYPISLPLPCGHVAFKYDTQWKGHENTQPRPCFESGEQLLLANSPILVIANGSPVYDFGPPSDAHWSSLMQAEQNPDRLAAFDTIREPAWQTLVGCHIQLFGRMFDVPNATCPVFAAHITESMEARISDMVESGQVASEQDMVDMALMWVKEEVACRLATCSILGLPST